jgi:predicted nuclease of predicted toxin-antitoxin system
MRLLLDMNISPEWVTVLSQADIKCVHWGSIGSISATDREIFNWAKEQGYTVLTHDLDFGHILSATNAEGPSVIQIRQANWLPNDENSQRIIDFIRKFSDELAEGALIVIDVLKHRVRMLPLSR